ncbi:bacillolysin [Lentibacillus halodurans]|uniref:Neutral metalloproteinase n=1 Tax=Lentibacillus halodurans TaxID=237679 RepID=A0A1I0Y4L0_9BACI|nr:M4 family metallopeptidase [Lentibacillus halodurans]SFB08279.1 bacillolysin [Lentibacillus halodurans]
MKKKYLASAVLSTAFLMGSITVSDAAVIGPSSNSSSVASGTEWNENANVPIFVKERFAKKQHESSAANAQDYLEKHSSQTGIQNARENLKVKDVQEDDLGMTHVRFDQVKNGVKVEGAEIIVHYNEDREPVSVNGYHNPQAAKETIDTAPELTSKKAVDAAKSSVNAPEDMKYDPETELVIYPHDDQHYLAYKVNITYLGDQPANWFVMVDAKNGQVIDQYNTIAAVDGDFHKGVGTGYWGDQRELHTTRVTQPRESTLFVLQDESHDELEGIYTYDADTDELVTNQSSSWKAEDLRPAVDAHYNSEKVYDYYVEEHDRNSLDDEGMPIISYVNYGTDFNNAFWNGRHMTYGNGDGSYMVPLSAGLDVAAHEMTHGVITHSANLVYRNQPGALNESFADIFGALVDEEDWEIGENIMGPGAEADGRVSLRSLSDPSKYDVNDEYVSYGNGEGKYPSHMDEYYDLPENLDNGGVHVNSSIINHAAYKTGEQIGKDKLGQIYYRALTTYLTPTSDFSHAREVIIQSATDIYGEGSEEEQAVADGFDQVGIY